MTRKNSYFANILIYNFWVVSRQPKPKTSWDNNSQSFEALFSKKSKKLNPYFARQIFHWNWIQSVPTLLSSNFLAHLLLQRSRKSFLSVPRKRGGKFGFFKWFNVSAGQKLAQILSVKFRRSTFSRKCWISGN